MFLADGIFAVLGMVHNGRSFRESEGVLLPAAHPQNSFMAIHSCIFAGLLLITQGG